MFLNIFVVVDLILLKMIFICFDQAIAPAVRLVRGSIRKHQDLENKMLNKK